MLASFEVKKLTINQIYQSLTRKYVGNSFNVLSITGALTKTVKTAVYNIARIFKSI